ncbi:MAG TPA: type II toxin-antitoxin system prevent-host-death family antitoxin [Acidobacteriaceae bacterium]|nr:type II toxin-antitoxin system prevent-host-death family antitoxin [Acidobacteriaceae bacterium]
MGAGDFKAKCLSVMNDVHNGHGEVVVTKRGEPFVKIVPIKPKEPESIFGFFRGQARIVGDMVAPIVEPSEWDEDIFPPGSHERDQFERNKAKPAKSKGKRR